MNRAYINGNDIPNVGENYEGKGRVMKVTYDPDGVVITVKTWEGRYFSEGYHIL